MNLLSLIHIYDEAILAMTDDNLRQRETILPSEKAMSLKMQYEAIKHQGARGDSTEAGKRALESVVQRNGMSVKTVQRYIWLNDLCLLYTSRCV